MGEFFKGDNSTSDQETHSDEFSEMEETLIPNEESAGDTVEGKPENEDSEVSHTAFIIIIIILFPSYGDNNNLYENIKSCNILV